MNEMIKKKVTKACPKYYEESYLIDECYEPVFFNEKSEKFYDDIETSHFYVNEEGQLAIQFIIKKQGGFDGYEEIIID